MTRRWWRVQRTEQWICRVLVGLVLPVPLPPSSSVLLSFCISYPETTAERRCWSLVGYSVHYPDALSRRCNYTCRMFCWLKANAAIGGQLNRTLTLYHALFYLGGSANGTTAHLICPPSLSQPHLPIPPCRRIVPQQQQKGQLLQQQGGEGGVEEVPEGEEEEDKEEGTDERKSKGKMRLNEPQVMPVHMPIARGLCVT